MSDEHSTESAEIILGVCGVEEFDTREFREYLEEINQEIAQTEKALNDLYLERKEAILKEFLMTPVSNAVETSSKFMTVPKADPLSKMF
jgi:hypothetical protein